MSRTPYAQTLDNYLRYRSGKATAFEGYVSFAFPRVILYIDLVKSATYDVRNAGVPGCKKHPGTTLKTYSETMLKPL